MSFISFFNGFFSPIKSSIIRVIVSESDRVKANSFISSVDQTFLFVGWTFGGLLLTILGKKATLVHQRKKRRKIIESVGENIMDPWTQTERHKK
jgi:hypothetical protein